MSLLLPETGLLFWMTISFGIVLLVLIRYGFPVILGAVEKRRAYIADSLAKAKQAEEHLASLNEQAEAILAKAEKERGVILEKGQKTAAGILQAAQQKAEEQSRARAARAEEEAAQLKRDAMDEVMGQIAGLSVKIAGKVLEEDLKEPGRQKKLIDKLLKEEKL